MRSNWNARGKMHSYTLFEIPRKCHVVDFIRTMCSQIQQKYEEHKKISTVLSVSIT
jgi:poly(3-hydroxybutyrate) depolymerase